MKVKSEYLEKLVEQALPFGDYFVGGDHVVFTAGSNFYDVF